MRWSHQYRVRFGQAFVLGLAAWVSGSLTLVAFHVAARNGWDMSLIGGVLFSVVFAATLAAGVEPGTSVLWGRRVGTRDDGSESVARPG